MVIAINNMDGCGLCNKVYNEPLSERRLGTGSMIQILHGLKQFCTAVKSAVSNALKHKACL